MTQTQTRRPVDQLPRGAASSERHVGAGLAALVGSLVLLLGVPVALVLLVGNPLPSGAPSRDWLTAEVTPTLVVNVLAVLVWVVWVHFVVCFLSEWRAIRRGRMPGSVLLGGGSQLLARRLVAGLLMLTGGLSVAQGLTSAATSAPEQVSPAQTAAATVADVGQVSAAEAAADAVGVVGAPAAVAGGAKHYEVVPPQGRHHDTLWDISQRLLGDPLRYKEIYDLNKHRMQPDGRRLTDADLIRPGWQLLLPADARGEGVHQALPSQVQLTPAPALPSAPSLSTLADNGVHHASGTDTASRSDERPGVDLGDLLLGGGLVLAGVVTALTAKRGPFGTPGDDEGALRLAANPVRSDLVDRALRILAESRRAQDLPMPDLSVVYVSDEQVIVHLVGDHEPPAAPWTASQDHTSWSVSAADVAAMHSDGPAPYPALVNLLESHGYDVLVDLEYASGLVAIGGDLGVAREVAMSSAIDLATHAWSDSVQVTLVGFGDDLADVAPERFDSERRLDDALDAVQGRLGAASDLLQRLGVDGVLSGRGTARHPELRPQVLVLSGPPSAEQTQRIRSLSSGGRTAFAAICVGDAPGSRWRFVVDQQGHLDLGVLGIAGTARRFSLDASARLRAMVSATVKEAAERTAMVPDSAPASLVPAPAYAVRTASDAPVTVRLLGDVEVVVAGGRPATPLFTEAVAMAALHPDGLHEAVLRSGLWPRGVTDDVVQSTLRDVAAWLGQDAQGRPRLRADDDGLWRLSEEVYVDWDELRACAAPASGAEVATYLRGLELAQGAAFSGTPVGRYTWLAWHRAARDARALVTSMASRVAALLGGTDKARADAALRHGLRLVPESELLWRDLIRLHGGDQPDGPASVVTEMRRALPDHRFEPETEALVAHLAPALQHTS